MATPNDAGLFAKIRALPADKVAEVEDFVDFLRQRVNDRALTRAAAQLSESAFAQVWDNPSRRSGSRFVRLCSRPIWMLWRRPPGFRSGLSNDFEPVRAVERAEFPRLVRRLLAQDTGRQVGGHESHLEYVKRLPRIHEDHLQGPTARVGDLQFAFFEADGWRFEGAWVSDVDESK